MRKVLMTDSERYFYEKIDFLTAELIKYKKFINLLLDASNELYDFVINLIKEEYKTNGMDKK